MEVKDLCHILKCLTLGAGEMPFPLMSGDRVIGVQIMSLPNLYEIPFI